MGIDRKGKVKAVVPEGCGGLFLYTGACKKSAVLRVRDLHGEPEENYLWRIVSVLQNSGE